MAAKNNIFCNKKSKYQKNIIFLGGKIRPLDKKIIFVFFEKKEPSTGHKVKFFLKNLLAHGKY
jgi:hypothetical protein